jgi:hypothetical protein
MFVLQHEMEWLTWHADKRPDSIGSEMVSAYESRVHDCYPRILGAMAVLAPMDLSLYHRLAPLMERIFHAESQIALLLGDLNSRRKRHHSMAQLRKLREPVTKLYLDLPPEMAALMRL